MTFEEEIRKLIDLHYEGAYWDFKVQWPVTEGGSLLHDIICMANNLEDRDAYIIIGVEDGSFVVKGIIDEANRKNTQQLNTYLKDKPFAGNIRPMTEVKELDVDGKKIDIIIIKRCTLTPIYLTQTKAEYKNLYPYHIYTRVMDSNTDKTGSADLDKVEQLWRKRFGLYLPAIDRFEVLIKETDKWKKCPFVPEQSQYIETWYHEIFPEFTIKISKDESGKAEELYMAEFLDPMPLWLNICVCYHNTVLSFFKGVALDGGRSSIVAPECWVKPNPLEKNVFLLHYYIKNSARFFLTLVLGGITKDLCFCDRLSEDKTINTILFFEDEQEYSLFKEHQLLPGSLDEISSLPVDNIYISPEVKNKELMLAHLKFSQWAKETLEEFRKNIKS